MSSIIKRTDWYAVTAFTVPFLVYLLTLAPSVTFFDSGEFLTAIFSLGSAHSPGYPLFVNYAKPFTWLPLGSIAFRVNMATAFSASAACLMTYLLCVRLLKNDERVTPALARMAGVAAGVAFAFTPRLWLQSNHDKPYPLVSVIAAVIFYLLLAWRQSYEEGAEDNRYIYISSFLFGAAFGAHQTIVLMLPAYGWLILSRNWRLICRVKELVIAFGFAILGISIYLHMPVRAVKNPLLNWGDPKTLTQFLWSFLRKGYPTETPDRDFALLLDQLSAFNVIREFTPAGFLFVVVALVFFRKRLKDEITAYIIGIVSFLVVIAGMQNTPRDLIFLTEEFFTPLYLLTAVFIGIGLSAAVATAARGLDPEKLKKRYVQIVILFILSLLPVTICSLNFRENDQHLNYIAYDYGMNTLRSLPKNAVLFTWGDSGAFPLWYLQGVERMREDVPLLHTPHLVFDWYLDSFPDLFRYSMIRRIPPENLGPENALFLSISEFISQRPVFIDFSTRYSIPFNGYGLEQHGITYRLVKNAGLLPPNSQVWDLYYSRGLFGDDMPFRDLDTGKAILIYANSHMEMGETLLRLGRTEQAMMEMRKAELISPEMKPQINQIMSGFGL